MKTPALPFARFGALALFLLVALPAEAININPKTADPPPPPPPPPDCEECKSPPRPAPPPNDGGGNPGSPDCPTCPGDATHTGVGSISFWQRFGRTPLVAEAPIGRMEIYEIGASRLSSGSGILRFNHPLMRRIVDRDVEKNVVTVEEGNGWLVTYRDGRPVGQSTAVLDDLRFEPDGTPVERLADRTLVYYNADNTVDHIVTSAGVRIDWDNAGLDVVWDGNAIGQVWSKADGLMDVAKLSATSFRLSWYPPAAVGEKENGCWTTTGNPGKTFTFSYSNVGGEHRLSLLEWRNETFHFDYLWKSSDGFDWTLVRDPDGLALSESMQSETGDGNRRVVRTFSDANGVLRRKTEYYKTGLVGTTLVGTGVIGDDGIERRVWSAFRIEDGVAAAHLSSTTNEYGGGTTYTYDEHRRLTSSSRLVNGNLSEVTTYQYPTNFVDEFADLRPSRRLVTRDGVVVSDTAYDYGFAPDGGRLDTVTRSDPVSGVSLVSSRLYYPVSSTNAAEAGRIRLSVSEDRTATLYAYAPTANGGYVRTATRGYIPEPDASAPGADASRFAIAPSQSTRTVETVNFRGDVVRVDEFVHTGDGWSAAGWTTYTFNLAHRRTGFADHKGDWEASDWICTGPVWQDLADGTAVTNTYDKAKRIATSTRYTPFGAVTTTYAYNAIGQIVGTTVSTNGVPVRGTLAAYDARGRRILSVDEQGRTNTVSYSADNRTVTRTTQAGAVTTTTLNTDGSVSTISGNVRPYETRSYGVNSATGLIWTEVRTAQNETAPSVLSSRTFRNAIGQTIRVERPAPNDFVRAILSSYNALGQLVSEQTEYRTQTPPLTSHLSPLNTSYAYDALGSLVRTAQTSTSGVWRAQSSSSFFSLDPDGSVWTRDFSISSCSDPSLAALTNRNDRKLAPLSQAERLHIVSYGLRGNATHQTESFDRTAARSKSSTLVPWAVEPSCSIALAGRMVEVVDFASVTNRFDYDALGQRIAATDGRGNTTVYSYDTTGQLSSITDAAGNETDFVYDAAGRTIETIDALGHSVHKAFDAADRTVAEWGATYPAVYAYDAYGRTIAIATTRDTNFVLTAESIPDLSNPPNALDVTRLNYDEPTGLLLDKRYADGKGPSYAYSPEGHLACRTWARGVTTDYAYDDFDSLVSKTYSDGTPTVSLRYDANGELLEAICEGVSTNVYAYDQYGQITNEIQNGTALARSYDSFGRPTGYCIGDGLAEGSAVSYSYDANGRFSAVSSGTNIFSYSYLPGSSLVSGMTANTGHAWDRIYEPNRDLIATVHNRYENRTISRFDYTNDEIGRRVNRVDSGESFSESTFERYTYNDRSELSSSQRFYGVDVLDCAHPVQDCSFGYSYDPIGNRLSSSEIIDGMPVVTLYESNELNQYIQTSNTISETEFEYDDDGNMVFDGQFHYSWNGENRMIRAEESFTPTNRMPTVITYAYDPQGRMVAKNLVGMNDIVRTFLWDGYNIIRETDNGFATYNTWGVDLNGTLQGYGGVGGLLSVCRTNSSYIAFYDANGNVADYVSETGNISAHYEYSQFGITSVSWGDTFSHNFSTKPFCRETGICEYQFRALMPHTGKWLSRDCLGEMGGINLYSLLNNNSANLIDLLGMAYGNPIVGPSGIPLPMPKPFENIDIKDYIIPTIPVRGSESYDSKACQLTISFRLKISMDPAWKNSAYIPFLNTFRQTIEDYFNGLSFRCFPTSKECCECQSGVRIVIQLVPVAETDPADFSIHFRSYSGPDYSDPLFGTASLGPDANTPIVTTGTYTQRPALHEFGHLLGLPHPSGRFRNQYSDYNADPDSLMGFGEIFRLSDFQSVFCSRISRLSQSESCSSWEAR